MKASIRLLSATPLLYSLRLCLAISEAKAVPLASVSANNDEHPPHRYIMHDQPGSGEAYWNDFLRNGREPRQNREHVHVDYMGQRE